MSSSILTILVRLLLFISIAIAIIPFMPYFPIAGLDPSWAFGMNEAVSKGMSIGSDIIFTFGPYSSVYTTLYHPDTAYLMYIASFIIAVVFGVVILRCFKNCPPFLIALFSLALVFSLRARDALFFTFIFSVGILVVLLLLDVKNQGKAARMDKIILLLGLVALSVLPLVKGTFLILTFGVWGMALILAVTEKNSAYFLSIFLLPLLSLAAFWMASGQDLFQIFNYSYWLTPIIVGYSDAMANSGNSGEIVFFVILSLMLFYWFIKSFSGNVWMAIFSSIFFISFFIVALKAGFVRHDGPHALNSIVFLLYASFIVAIVFRFKIAWMLLLFPLLFTVLISMLSKYVNFNYEDSFRILAYFYSAPKSGYDTVVNGEGLNKRFRDSVSKLSGKLPISKVKGKVDIYSWDQSLLLSENVQWSPRPVFQSYSAYTESLVKVNTSHLRSPEAPEFILYRIQTIDDRFPTLDDGLSFVEILKNYTLQDIGSSHLLFKRRDDDYRSIYQFSDILSSGAVGMGEIVHIPATNEPLFLRVELEKSLVGKIVSALFKPSKIVIHTTLVDGTERSFRLVSGMTNSGFLLSPLLMDNEDVSFFVVDPVLLGNNVVESFSIDVDGWSWLWADSFEYSLSKLKFNKNENAGALKRLGFRPMTEHLIQRPLSKSSINNCGGHIDQISVGSNSVSLRGWLSRNNENMIAVKSPVLFIRGEGNIDYAVPMDSVSRQDVVTHLNNSSLDNSGFSIRLLVPDLSGDYELEVGYIENGEAKVCSNLGSRRINLAK